MKYSLLMNGKNFAWSLVLGAMLTLGAWAAQATGPVLTVPATVTMGEDAAATNVSISVADSATNAGTVTITAKSSNTNLASVAMGGSGDSQTLTITPGLHKSGTATITLVAVDEQPVKTTNTIALTVTFTNYPPTFTSSLSDMTRNENAGPTNLTFAVSDIQTASSSLVVTATSSNTTLVPNNDLVLSITGTNRTLRLSQATNQYGTTLITLVVTDGNGSTATNSFLLTVSQVNQPPSFTIATNRLSYLENYGLVTNSNFVSNVSSGPANQAGQTTSFAITTSSNAFFSQLPALDTNGTLTFEVATNTFGTNTITIVLSNSGGTDNGGRNSATNILTLDVPFVHQAPSFSLSTNVVHVNEETAAVVSPAFLTDISTGPSNQDHETWSFTTVVATNSATNVVFKTMPVIAANGTLTFAPEAHSFGTNWVTVIMTASGGTANGGVDTATNSFVIQVQQTNHAPVIVATNVTVLENGATNVVATVNVWDYDTNSSNITLTATSLNTALAHVAVSTNVSVPTLTNAIFTLDLAPLTNQNGVVTIQLVATESNLSTTNTIKFTITPVTQPPSFSLSTNIFRINEETLSVVSPGFLTNISAGPTNQSHETWKFALSNYTNPEMDIPSNVLFKTFPAISANGTLTFKPEAHSYGTNVIVVIMTTSGSTNNGGVNECGTYFILEVAQTNHAPVIVATNVTTLESGTNTNSVTATVNLWDYDTDSSNLTLTATSLNPARASVTVSTNVSVPSLTNAVFTMNLTALTNQNGAVSIRLVGTEGPLSTTNTITFNITPVNQAPSFSLSSNAVLVEEETASVIDTDFLTNISAGPTNQSHESWKFTLTAATNNATNVVFKTLPAIAQDGTLTFKPQAHSYGTNWVTILMTTTGSTNNGGVNTFSNAFLIEVAQTNHNPVIVMTNNVTMLENSTNGGTFTVNVWDYDKQSSNLSLTVTSLNTNLGSASVATNINIASPTNAVFTVKLTPATNQNGVVTMQLVAAEGSLSTTNTMTLTITPVNQAPSFTLSTNIARINEETLSVTNVGFLTNISAGPTNQNHETWTFTTTAATNSGTNVVFTVLPAIAANGTLTYKPQAHSYGTNWVTVIMTTSGSTNNGGVNTCSNAFVIQVAQTNHAPVIVAPTNISILENSTNLVVTNVNVWDYDTQSSNLTLTATSTNTTVATVSIPTNTVGSPTNSVFVLNLVPLTNANRAVNITLVATEGPLSTTNTLVFNIIPVNQPPSYSLSTNVVATNENAGAISLAGFLTNLSAGPLDESNQTWTFAVLTATNGGTNATFSQYPTVSTNGTLNFTIATNSFGTNFVSVIMTDSGGTNNGGINTYSNSFELKVAQVMYAPEFTGLTNKSILENGTSNLTMAFTLYDHLNTNFNVTCLSSNTNLVTVALSGTNSARTITFTPVTNQNGNTTITVTAGNGVLTNSTNITLTVLPVNQPPSFDLACQNISVIYYNVQQNFSSAVTNISPGPTNESTQTVTFTVTNSNPSLFTLQPAIDTNGNLTFTTSATGGTVTVGVKAVDNGGTLNGGNDTSPVQTMTITIPSNPFTAVAGPFAGLFFNTNSGENASSGYFKAVLATNGTYTGYLLNAGASNTFSGQFNLSNVPERPTTGNYELGLSINTATNIATITGSVTNTSGSWVSTLSSYLVGSSTSLAGTYLLAMPGFADPTAGPAGDSIFSMTVSNAGGVSLTGYMADDTACKQVSQISSAGYYPLYIPLYNGGAGGSVIGWLYFSGTAESAVATNSVLTWFNDSGATTLYPSGFTEQVAPEAALYTSGANPLLSSTSGSVILSGGNLTNSITNSVTISGTNITVGTTNNGLTLTIDSATGEVVGSFVNAGATNAIDSVILQAATNSAAGYFIGTSEGGSFQLIGN